MPVKSAFLRFQARGARIAFTSRSSRYLNCPSNLIGHDHPNKPANGERMIRQSVGGFGDQIMRSSIKRSAIGRKTGFHFC